MTLGYSDFKLTLHYFAKDDALRLYTDSGQYVNVKQLDEIPQAVKQLLSSSAKLTLETLK